MGRNLTERLIVAKEATQNRGIDAKLLSCFQALFLSVCGLK